MGRDDEGDVFVDPLIDAGLASYRKPKVQDERVIEDIKEEQKPHPRTDMSFIGTRHGKLTVKAYAGSGVSGDGTQTMRSGEKKQLIRTLWLCVCDCGGQVVTTKKKLTRRERSSCGCLRKQKAKETDVETP